MKIVVLAGGTSTERDVSLNSGRMIYRTLREKGHKVILLDVYLGYEGSGKEAGLDLFEKEEDWAEGIRAVGEKNPDMAHIKAMRPDGEQNFFGPQVLPLCQAADVVFMALHGENGENGKIQACFDLMGIRYTGTDYLSSALAMNKGLSKELFRYHGIPTPAGVRLKQGTGEPVSFPFPRVVKANSGGSSVGVYLVENEKEYEEALEKAFSYDQEVIVEQYIKGREFSVGVLSGKALPVIEIAPLQGFYDYVNKYQAGNAVETCPAELRGEKTAELQRHAELVFEALRLKNYARIDFMMNEKEEFFCLEANTLPGMTPTSLLPQEAAAAGMTFLQLCEAIIDSALHG